MTPQRGLSLGPRIWRWPDKASRPHLGRACWHLVAGCQWLAVTSKIIAAVGGGEAFGWALISIVCGMFFLLLGVAFWAIVRRSLAGRRASQFSLRALFMATAVVAPYVLLIRFLAELGPAASSGESALLEAALAWRCSAWPACRRCFPGCAAWPGSRTG